MLDLKHRECESSNAKVAEQGSSGIEAGVKFISAGLKPASKKDCACKGLRIV